MKEPQNASFMGIKVFSKVLVIFLVGALLAVMAVPAEAKPKITSCDVNYAGGTLTVNVQWQSENPVVMVRLIAGAELKEVPVGEFENTRTPRGYRGDVSAAIQVQNPGDSVPYVVQLVDDVRGKSEQHTGKVVITKKAAGGTAAQSGEGIKVGDKVYGKGNKVTLDTPKDQSGQTSEPTPQQSEEESE